ncbi:VIT domain-containing protein [Aquimarina rhabdastrellae]
MKQVLLFLTLIVSNYIQAQLTPRVTIAEEKDLKLTHLKVAVKIIGNYATTTYDMKFYNELDRTLEGELVFPLSEGQTVSKFAMEVGEELREAVVVEKEQARVAFESTVRQNIDPGLLEKVQGNNYKARIYPILPKSYKRIVLTFEQTLHTVETSQVYELPLGITTPLEHFKLDIQAFTKVKPRIENKNSYDLVFKKRKEVYQTKLSREKYNANKPIVIKIDKDSIQDEVLTYGDYFHLYKILQPQTRLKNKPKKITILWDASFSMKDRNLDQELELLHDYFQYLANVEVRWVTFSNKKQQDRIYTITNGNWEQLKTQIKQVVYDGGTSYEVFKDLKITTDEILLFTDGLSNLGAFRAENKKPIYAINTVVSADHSKLKEISTITGGNYINLIRKSSKEAITLLKRETYQFIRAKHSKVIKEVYPNQPTNVDADFTLSGKFLKEGPITLYFGYQGRVTDSTTVMIKIGEGTEEVKRLWAKQKLKSLMKDKIAQKQAIINLGKHYHLITAYTSMIILDRIEDYVRYRIEPPKDLRAEYKRRIEAITVNEIKEQERIQRKRKNLIRDYLAIQSWYDSNYFEKNVESEQDEFLIGEDRDSTNTRNSVRDNANTKTISGVVLDETGVALPGVNVVVKGTTIGTQTDFDGRYTITVIEGDVLEFSYVGFSAITQAVRRENTLNIRLNSASSELEEVVIVAQEVRREKRTLGYAVTNEKNEQSITLKAWNPKVPYIKLLAKEKSIAKAYYTYNKIRIAYNEMPTFYLDVADFFDKKNAPDIAIMILTNLIEIELDNYELIKALGYKLTYFKQYDLAVKAYEKVLELRPEDPQSYRDLALAYEKVGAIQKSFDLLFKIYNGELLEKEQSFRFHGIEQIAYIELTRLLNTYKNKLKLSKEQKENFTGLPVDIRIVIDWNHNDTDIDLWVIDPKGEKAFYSNKLTKIGGRMSNDMTSGFGPEEFMLKKAISGTYKVMANYFADTKQKISGPTILKATMFLNYGKENEKEEVIIIRLEDDKKEIEIGELFFE